jgi:phosphoribosylamine--glycine ligase
VATLAEAKAALAEMMQDGKFGTGARTVVIEEFLFGEEFSYMAFVHGEQVYPMALAQDHKRAYDGDKGPNTGGMGAYSPVPQIDADTLAQATDIMRRTAAAMVKEGRSFTGFLFGGLIATSDGPKVIEFNARFGDPETEVLLPRLSSDLYTILTTILQGEAPEITWSEDIAMGVILASEGYPDEPITGAAITGLDSLLPDTRLFHCGTSLQNGTCTTAGGRVLMLVRTGADFPSVRDALYQEVDKIKCAHLFCRRDIGWRVLK